MHPETIEACIRQAHYWEPTPEEELFLKSLIGGSLQHFDRRWKAIQQITEHTPIGLRGKNIRTCPNGINVVAAAHQAKLTDTENVFECDYALTDLYNTFLRRAEKYTAKTIQEEIKASQPVQGSLF